MPKDTLVTLLPNVKCYNLYISSLNYIMACFLTGITAEESPTRHYRLKHGSFCLRFGNSSQRDDIMWTFNEGLIVLHKKVTTKTEKMEYNPSDMSLCINNVTETDSGIYKILFVNSKNKQSMETHILIVEGKFYIVLCL